MSAGTSTEATLGRPKHHWVRNTAIVLAILAVIFATGAILCTIY